MSGTPKTDKFVAKMLCHITRPDSVVLEVEVDAKANGEDCLNKVSYGIHSRLACVWYRLCIRIHKTAWLSFVGGQRNKNTWVIFAKLYLPSFQQPNPLGLAVGNKEPRG